LETESVSPLLVKFRFDGEIKSEIVELTYEQYSNIKELPITVECKIVKNQTPTISKQDMDKINKKLSAVFKKSKSHTEALSE
jgi:hypothetical protein